MLSIYPKLFLELKNKIASIYHDIIPQKVIRDSDH